MSKSDKSFFKDPEYSKNLSNGIRESKKFQEYTERRRGEKRGRYLVDKESAMARRLERLDLIKNQNLKSLLADVLNKDSSTFSCYSQVYLHLEGTKIIPNLTEFFNIIEKKMFSGDYTLKQAMEVYKKLGLDKLKLGKSSTVIKSIYSFREFGSHPQKIIEVSKKI